METIIVKPKTASELKEVLGLLRKMKVKTELYKERTNKEILSSIEGGAKSASAYLKGKRRLREAKDLLDEL